MALAIVTANTSASESASSSCPASPVSPGSAAILACPGNEADKKQTQHQQQHRVGDNDNCPLLHGNDLGLSAVPNLHSSQHIALSSSQSVRTETGQRAMPCRAVPGDTIYTTLTIKIRGGAATVTSKQQRTQLFLLSYTRSTNLPALTVTGHLSPARPFATPTAGPLPDGSCHPAALAAHIVDANQSVKWSDPKLWLENTL